MKFLMNCFFIFIAQSFFIQNLSALEVYRVQVDWSPISQFRLGSLIKEDSGTHALYQRVLKEEPRGSFKATLRDPLGGEPTQYAAIGTGYNYKELVRSLTFRFRPFKNPHLLTVLGENPRTGQLEVVAEQVVDPKKFVSLDVKPLIVKTLQKPLRQESLILTFYSENYKLGREEQFWVDAKKMTEWLNEGFPGIENFEIRAAFSSSNYSENAFDELRDLLNSEGSSIEQNYFIPESPTFLGFYFPYWIKNMFDRYYDIIYPTSEIKMRNGMGQTQYDYPIVITDSKNRYASATFNAFAALPSNNKESKLMLLHEFGHYYGLQEEYSSTGTELLIAPEMVEPWSQNITFNSDEATVKWKELIKDDYGIFEGGYGGLQIPHKHTYIPSRSCAMNYQTGKDFCDVCKKAILEKIDFDLGH